MIVLMVIDLYSHLATTNWTQGTLRNLGVFQVLLAGAR